MYIFRCHQILNFVRRWRFDTGVRRGRDRVVGAKRTSVDETGGHKTETRKHRRTNVKNDNNAFLTEIIKFE